MTDTNTAEREAFEAWIAESGRGHMLKRDPENGWHEDLEVTARWAAWQARAHLAASAGSEPVADSRPSLEAVFRGLSDRAYCNYIEQMGRNECLGWKYKVKNGTFGEAELKGHTKAGEMLGRHKAFAEAAIALRGSVAPLTHPSPPEGMEGWISVDERLPQPFTPVLIHPRPTDYCCEGEVNTQRQWSYGEYETGFGHHQIKCKVTHWQPMPAPPLPASEAKEP